MTVWATRADHVDLRGPNPHDLARSPKVVRQNEPPAARSAAQVAGAVSTAALAKELACARAGRWRPRRGRARRRAPTRRRKCRRARVRLRGPPAHRAHSEGLPTSSQGDLVEAARHADPARLRAVRLDRPGGAGPHHSRGRDRLRRTTRISCPSPSTLTPAVRAAPRPATRAARSGNNPAVQSEPAVRIIRVGRSPTVTTPISAIPAMPARARVYSSSPSAAPAAATTGPGAPSRHSASRSVSYTHLR